MRNVCSILMFCLFITSSIFSIAQEATFSKGSKVKILEIDKSDAYYSERSDFVGNDATVKSDLTKDSKGFYSGTLETSSGRVCYFSKVKLTQVASSKTALLDKTSSIKFITGTIKKGTIVYVADISKEDSYYSDRHEHIGKKGKVTENDMEMKEDGYYAGDFAYDDGKEVYFYKAKFSKDPVPAVEKSADDVDDTNASSEVYDWLGGDDKVTDESWNDARNDDDIKEGDKVEITAISPEDGFYDDRADYIGKQGIAGDDIDFQSDEGGYSGTVKLSNDKDDVYFYLVKLKKVSSSNTSSKIAAADVKSSSSATKISKGTKVMIMSLSPDDSYYINKEDYLRKKGTVTEGLDIDEEGYYSGNIKMDGGAKSYFYKVKVKVIQ
ncbi:MAG TPA: hypothetical protein PKK18_02215 [Chitinophagales bacterium]|nr:hypothetical protein [Chitinophagales bacterium]HMW11950.1 hypothetical protein [Chitinophagales bacterium]HMX59576.1 hypothetical protein [Chitinophagales bacterium]HMY23256.1 hypothetical protein [Chitinophagales bacterium]HMZ33037.1 hypothetical protein [Chitinophagales bacterium]